MTLEKAIEILTQQVRFYNQIHQIDIINALGIGIEATKFRQRWEQQEGEDDFPLLPGETKD